MPAPFDIDTFMARLRGLCASFPGSEEYLMHGHVAFRVGKKPFVIVGEGDGHGEVGPTLNVKVDLEVQPLVLQDPRFFKTHYIGHHGWVSLILREPFAWGEVERLVDGSWRRAAPRKAAAAHPAPAGR